MGILRSGLNLVFVLLCMACSQTVKPQDAKTTIPEKNLKSESFGVVRSVDGKDIDLDQLSGDALVLVFASDTCATCAQEAGYWKEIFSIGLPKNINFIHVLIGGVIEDAADWKNQYQVIWPVTIDENQDRLFRKYCSEIRTPCFVISQKDQGIITQSYEVLQKQQIEEITGTWKF